jgi:flagellar motor switch/type III secretory pathway protein FliN
MSQAVTRDLALLRPTDLTLVEQALTSPWRQWAEAWGLELPIDAALVASAPGPESAALSDLGWQPLHSASPSLAAWTHVPADWRAKLAAQLIGRSGKASLPEDDFSLAAADRALDDLLQRWRQALPEASAAQGGAYPVQVEQAWLPYAGAVLLTESRSGLMCLLGREAYHPLLPQAKAAAAATVPSGLLRTLAQHRLPVSLGLGEVEIPVSDLLGLQTGDVIQFPIRLSDELPLTLAADASPAPALTCQLGQLDGRLAIKVVAKAKAKAA